MCCFCLTLRVNSNNVLFVRNFAVNHGLSRKGFASVEILKGSLCLSQFLLNQNKKGHWRQKNDVYISNIELVYCYNSGNLSRNSFGFGDKQLRGGHLLFKIQYFARKIKVLCHCTQRKQEKKRKDLNNKLLKRIHCNGFASFSDRVKGYVTLS